MLNIPQVIKDQFKIDNVLKNIRISFPNGEHADICNDQIIKETLKFDESISSREEVKFGLCESSTLSFECVDVENIKGMEIAADIEIDATGITSDIAPTNTHEPVIICATPRGETEEKFFVIFDFPVLGDGETYLSSDNVDIAWKGSLVDDVARVRNYDDEHMPKLSQYRNITGVDPRGTSEDTYDGLQGGGFLRTYVYSVTTGKFYSLLRMEFEYEEDILPFSIQYDTAFENDEFLEIINHIYLDAESREYMYPVETQTSPDVPFPFYRVPLGHFIVDEAKRDASMRKRRIVAYSLDAIFPSYDWWTQMDWYTAGTPTTPIKVDLDIINFIAATVPEIADTSDRESVTFTRSRDSFTINVDITGSDRNTYRFKLEIYGCWYADIYNTPYYVAAPWPSTAHLGIVEKCVISSSYQTSMDEAIAGFEAQNVPEDVIEKITAIISYYRPFNVLNAYRNPNICQYATDEIPHSDYVPLTQQKGKEFKEGDLFIMPWKLALYSQIVVTNMSGHAADSFRIYLSDAGLNIDNVLKISKIKFLDGYHLTIPIYPDIRVNYGQALAKNFLLKCLSLNMRELLEGNIEVFGCFGRMGRNGKLQLLSIADIEIDGLFPNHDVFPNNALYPTPYTPISIDTSALAIVEENCMIDLWYEEYAVKFGGITLDYMSSEILDEDDNPTEATYVSIWNDADDAIIYDLSNNTFIKALTCTEAQIKSLIDPLVQALKRIEFYPHDMKCVGLPYIEAGDWVFASYHGNRILGLILSRTLDGIQVMRDKMKSD
jgi:hypothetical protein